MDIRFQLKGVRMTGVCPLGAQVRRAGGVSEMPDSSWKTSHALRRRAFFYLGTAGGHPLINDLVVAFERCGVGRWGLQPSWPMIRHTWPG